MTQSETFKTVRVDLGARSYDILVGPGTLGELGTRLPVLLKQPRVFVLTDETVGALHRARLENVLAPSGINFNLEGCAGRRGHQEFLHVGRGARLAVGAWC